MNRETELRFSELPSVEKPRSKFKRPFTHKTAFYNGDIVPIYLDQDILPGDTVKINVAEVVRSATPLYPVMDNSYLDVMFFFVPNRLVWEHWKEFWGENPNPWYNETEYEIPQIETEENATFTANTVADYFGLPLGVEDLSVSALPFRAYVKIYNDFFRDENLQSDTPNYTDDTDRTFDDDYATLGGACLKANKFHDYFTSALPSPQKGPSVTVPIGTWAPVYPRDIEITSAVPIGDRQPLKFRHTLDSLLPVPPWALNEKFWVFGKTEATPDVEGEEKARVAKLVVSTDKMPNAYQPANNTVYPTNLWTDLTNATSSTINQLRQAFAIQRFFEAQARGGSRYIEFIKNIFGVTSPDARLQRSEYLGGKRIPLNIHQVPQTSSTVSTSPLGNTGAFGHTADADEYFTKSFTEHGIIIGVAIARTDHTYCQGIEKGWSRKKWTDFYIPQFAHLSEQPILNKEIFAQGTSEDEEVFGYQEAWAEYRYKPSICSNLMRTDISGTLASWNYADDYDELPTLSSSWIKEPTENVARTLADTTDVQYIADFYFDTTYVRPMPVYSVPGLLDHM